MLTYADVDVCRRMPTYAEFFFFAQARALRRL
jgi:hypothetical protein